MANALFSLAKQKMLEGSINWVADDIRVSLVDGALYAPNLTTDEFLDDVVLGGAVISGPISLANKTNVLGVVDADDVVLPSVSGSESEILVIYKFVTNDADSPVIAMIDTATGLPVTPDGNNINIIWDAGVNKIFAL